MQPIMLTLTPTEAEELYQLLHWTNDPKFRGLIDQLELASADSLDRSSADSSPDDVNESKELN